jgi:ribosomal 50S subunit-recycling heat shock protein
MPSQEVTVGAVVPVAVNAKELALIQVLQIEAERGSVKEIKLVETGEVNV